MRLRFLNKRRPRLFLLAIPTAILCTLFFPAIASAHVFGNDSLTGYYTGQIDAPTIFNFAAITLFELGAIFWVGAQLWLNFALQISSEKHNSEKALNEQTQARFERRFSLPTLLVVLLANIGVLVGQALNVSDGNWAASLSPATLFELATSSRSGVFWLIGEGTIILAIVIALYTRLSRQHPRWVDALLPLLNLLLGLVLFIAITMASYTAFVSSNILTFTIILEWLHLLAIALWVGGILYIAAIYLPTLKKRSLTDMTRSLATVLPYFRPLAIAGVIITFITVLFSATLNQVSLNQLINTAYGRALVVEIVLLAGLLICSIIQIFLFSPSVGKEYRKYAYTESRLATVESTAAVEVEARQSASVAQPSTAAEPIKTTSQSEKPLKRITQQVRLREKRLTDKTHLLTSLLRWESLLGVAVLVCIGLMYVFAGTLSPITAAAQQQPGGKHQSYMATLRTKDGKFTATLEINPNLFGTNVFTVSVIDNSTGKADTNVGVAIYTTMLDMDMGTQSVNLLPDGKGHFSASGELSMAGHWQIRLQIRTPDNTLHEASANIVTAF